MPNMTMTQELAYAVGTDAGNRAMRKAGRKAWSREDFNIAAERTARTALHAGIIGPAQYRELTGLDVPANYRAA